MLSDYERLMADLHWLNEHDLRNQYLDQLPAECITAHLMHTADAMAGKKGMVWKVMMSEPHDPTQRYWIILEGRVFSDDAK